MFFYIFMLVLIVCFIYKSVSQRENLPARLKEINNAIDYKIKKHFPKKKVTRGNTSFSSYIGLFMSNILLVSDALMAFSFISLIAVILSGFRGDPNLNFDTINTIKFIVFLLIVLFCVYVIHSEAIGSFDFAYSSFYSTQNKKSLQIADTLLTSHIKFTTFSSTIIAIGTALLSISCFRPIAECIITYFVNTLMKLPVFGSLFDTEKATDILQSFAEADLVTNETILILFGGIFLGIVFGIYVLINNFVFARDYKLKLIKDNLDTISEEEKQKKDESKNVQAKITNIS